MSVGKDKYDARRERELLNEQELLKDRQRTVAGNAFLDLAIVALTAFLNGTAYLNVNGAIVKFILPTSPTEKDDGHGRG